VLVRFAGDTSGQRLLDVGTGTGRAALLFAQRGARVMGVDASAAMLAMARQRAMQKGLRIGFLPGDAHALCFAARSFDVVISLRVLMHAARWKDCVAELCRVAGRAVIVDYPSARSVAMAQSLGRKVMHAVGARTEPYRVLRHRQVERAFNDNGFRIRAVHRQFVLPIALHKALGSRRFTERSEQLLERAGLLKAFGSPVTIVAERA
jgi:ubiquinone/menaquinone biosynthesis C-methylase UbiE